MRANDTEARGQLIDVSELSLRQLEDLACEVALGDTLREILDPSRGEPSAAGFDAFMPQ